MLPLFLPVLLLLVANNGLISAAAPTVVKTTSTTSAASTASADKRVSENRILRRWGIQKLGTQNISINASSKTYAPSSPKPFPGRQFDAAPRSIVILGGPASGKGTQCEVIAKNYGVVHISTGDMLRTAVTEDSGEASIGGLAKAYMDAGELVPDRVIVELVKNRINQPDCQRRGYLLDGFPRTKSQAMAMSSMGIRPETIIYIDVPDEILIERVIGRRMDPKTGKIYHTKYRPPPSQSIEQRLITRSDDTEEKARNRLASFHKNLGAVSSFKDITTVIDGRGKANEVAESIDIILSQRTKRAV